MLAPHSCHSGKEYGGVLWNPKVFRRFLPEQFTRKMSDAVYVNILKSNDYIPCDVTPIIEDGEGYYSVIKKIVSFYYRLTDSVIASQHYRRLSKVYDEVLAGDDEAALDVLTSLTVDQNRAESLLKTIKRQLDNLGNATLKDVLRSGYSKNQMFYDSDTDTFYICKPHFIYHCYNYITDFTGLVPDEYVALFNTIGDPSDPGVYENSFHYWRAGLFYTLINHEIFVNGLSFEKTISKAKALLDEIDYCDMDALIGACHDYAIAIRKS